MLLGVAIVLVGVVLLLRTTGLYEVDYLLRFVPSLFVLLGIYALVVSGFRNVVGAGIVILVAGAWQLVTLGYLEAEQLWDLWPLLIVFFGVSVLLGQYRSRREPTSADHPTALAIFGGSEPRSTSTQFTGADLTALFGGVELDLREAEVADPPAHVSATVAFGGAEIRVPEDWTVRLDVLPLFGGASDERPRSPAEHEEVDLVVTGLALFGGVSIE
jgi:hypothetical protein